MAPKRIVVVDDSLTIRKMIEMALSRDGYAMVSAKTGDECLKAVAECSTDLILADYMLPDMQGSELCQWLLRSPQTKGTPVLVISDDGNAARQLYQDAENVVDYLTKPFAPDVLRAVVGNILAKWDSEHENGEMQEALYSGEISSETVERRAQKIEDHFKAHLASLLKGIPEWEAQRGDKDPENYYLEQFSRAGLWGKVARDLWKIARGGEDVFFRCQTDFVSADAALAYLNVTQAGGVFRVETPNETVLAYFEDGKIIAIETNEIRGFTKESFQEFQVPAEAVSRAIARQQHSFVPAYVSLHKESHFPDRKRLERLIQEQGERVMAQALSAVSAVCSFTILDEFPPSVLEFRGDYRLPQLLLLAYRMAEDTALPDPDLHPVRNPRCESLLEQVQLLEMEEAVLKQVTGQKSIREIGVAAVLPPQEVSRVIHRLMKLGVIEAVSPPISGLDSDSVKSSAERVISPLKILQDGLL